MKQYIKNTIFTLSCIVYGLGWLYIYPPTIAVYLFLLTLVLLPCIMVMLFMWYSKQDRPFWLAVYTAFHGLAGTLMWTPFNIMGGFILACLGFSYVTIVLYRKWFQAWQTRNAERP